MEGGISKHARCVNQPWCISTGAHVHPELNLRNERLNCRSYDSVVSPNAMLELSVERAFNSLLWQVAMILSWSIVFTDRDFLQRLSCICGLTSCSLPS